MRGKGRAMRKNLLASVTGPDAAESDHDARSEYTRRGASRSMRLSIDEMAENVKKMTAGEMIVNIDPVLIDSSFISDRLEDEDYFALRDAIREHGQLSPVLLRPHPQVDGRYMVVFGHRRTRATRELGIPVRAVIKNVEDIAHIIMQGQENTARANLSFIEKALFARKLIDMGQSKDVVRAALTVDDTLLSRMLSVTDVIPRAVIEAIGTARTVGRDRWEELKKLVALPATAQQAVEIAKSPEFLGTESGDRFSFLLDRVRKRRKPVRRSSSVSQESSWTPKDNLVLATFRNTEKTFSLSLKSKDARDFGKFISSNLDQLYEAFRETKNHSQTGD